MKITIKNLCSINNARVAVTTASLALLLVFTACSENGFSEDGASGASTKGSVVSSIVAYLPGSDSKALKKSAASIDANDMHTVATVYEDDTLANQIKVSWEENDAFNVTNGSDTVKFAAHGIKATGNATEFKPLNEEDEIVCSDDKSCTAIYPKMIMDASDEGVKNYLLSKESQGRTINVNKSKEDQNKFDELWKQNVMTSQVTKQGDKYVVHFEHKVALVDISIKFGEATTINEIGIYGPRGEKYFATILDDSKDVSYKANETAKAVIAVPPFALKEKDNLTVFVTKSDDSVVRYKRKLVKDVKFELGQYYALSFDKENIALDHEYIDGVEVVDMGHCGLWAKEDFAKNGKYYFAKGYGSVSEKIYYDWDLYSYLRKKPETLTGLPHWEVPTTGDFENLYDCEASVADDGSVTFVSVSDTVHLGKATYSTSVGGFWISSSYGFVYYVSASNEWLEESVLPILHRVPHRIHLVPVVAGTCSGKLYTEDQFCLDGVITEKCGGETYSDDQFCLNDVVKEKCNGETYADDKFCDNNKLYDKCGGEQFSTAREFCLDGVITEKCGGKEYTSDEFCFNGKVTEKCGGKTYDPSKQECFNNRVYNLLIDERDGQIYRIVTIGTQTWMAENLNYETTNSWCYEDQADSCAKYGRLYTWAAAMDSAAQFAENAGTKCGYHKTCTPNKPHRGICPEGWHVPTNNEYTSLYTYIGESEAGAYLKSTSGWKDSRNGTDNYGFSVLPAGHRHRIGFFEDRGRRAYLWSASEYDYDRVSAYYFNVDVRVLPFNFDKDDGFSLRCLQDCFGGKTYTADQFCLNDVVKEKCNGETYADGKFCFDNKLYDKCGGEEYNPSTQFCRMDKEVVDYNYLIDDRDGQTYKTVTIGTQTWMAENLNYEYNKGSAKSYCINDNADSCAKYGRLYTWSAAMDSAAQFAENAGTKCGYAAKCTPNTPHRGICPEGWHVPTEAEYTTLYTYIGGTSTASTYLKSTSGWKDSCNGTNNYGFSVLPAGFCYDGIFYDVGYGASLWSASENGPISAYGQDFYHSYAGVDQNSYSKYYGYSLRCLQDSN